MGTVPHILVAGGGRGAGSDWETAVGLSELTPPLPSSSLPWADYLLLNASVCALKNGNHVLLGSRKMEEALRRWCLKQGPTPPLPVQPSASLINTDHQSLVTSSPPAV